MRISAIQGKVNSSLVAKVLPMLHVLSSQRRTQTRHVTASNPVSMLHFYALARTPLFARFVDVLEILEADEEQLGRFVDLALSCVAKGLLQVVQYGIDGGCKRIFNTRSGAVWSNCTHCGCPDGWRRLLPPSTLPRAPPALPSLASAGRDQSQLQLLQSRLR